MNSCEIWVFGRSLSYYQSLGQVNSWDGYTHINANAGVKLTPFIYVDGTYYTTNGLPESEWPTNTLCFDVNPRSGYGLLQVDVILKLFFQTGEVLEVPISAGFSGVIEVSVPFLTYSKTVTDVNCVFSKKTLNYGIPAEIEKFLVLPENGMQFDIGEDLVLFFQTKAEFQIKTIGLNGNDWTPPIVGNNQSATINFGAYNDNVVLTFTARSIWEWASKFKIHGITLSGLDKETDWILASGGVGTLPSMKYREFYLEGYDGAALNPGAYSVTVGGQTFVINVSGNDQFSQPLGQEVIAGSGSGNISVNTQLDLPEPSSAPSQTAPSSYPPADGSGNNFPVPVPVPLPLPAPVPVPGEPPAIPPQPPSGGGCQDPCMQELIAVVRWHGELLAQRLGEISVKIVEGNKSLSERLDRIQQSQGACLEKFLSFGDDLDDVLENFFNKESPDYSQVLGEIKGELEGINQGLHVDGDTDGSGIADREQVIMVDGLEIRSPKQIDEG